jgi:calcineurin-like phosphoesterase family protein
MKKTTFKVNVIFALLGLILILSFGFNSVKSNYINNLNRENFDFYGTNSLFIETDNGLKFNWITMSNDIGTYELIDSGNSVIAEGETATGRVHSVSIDHKIKDNLIFRFGGQKDSIIEVRLRPIPMISKSIFKNIDSLFVVGDVHGRYMQLINLLQKSNVINNELNWIAGKSNLVFLGDLFDRGNDVTKLLWFIYELEEEAEKAGGKIHVVLGNHEIMTMTNDLRYIGAKESIIAGVYKTKYDYMFHPTKSFLGSWLTSKPSVLKIDKNLLAHGGIVDLGTSSIEEFNQTVYSYMQDPMFIDIMKDHPDSSKYDPWAWRGMQYFFYNQEGPYWYRGYVNYDTLDAQLSSMLRKYRSKIHIVAHTTLENITQKYDGKLLTTDLDDAATQLLLLVKKKNGYYRYKIDSAGEISELQ